MTDLKLFLWTKVLTDYTHGVMFAIAEDEAQARAMILAKYKDWHCDLAVTEDEFTSPPQVIEGPFAFALCGGG